MTFRKEEVRKIRGTAVDHGSFFLGSGSRGDEFNEAVRPKAVRKAFKPTIGASP